MKIDKLKDKIPIIIFVLLLSVLIYNGIIIKYITEKNSLEKHLETVDPREFLDNGIKKSEYIEKKEFLKNYFETESKRINEENKIEITLKNISGKDVYLSNELYLEINETGANLLDYTKNKTLVKPGEKAQIISEDNIQKIFRILEEKQVDIKEVKIYKPVYKEEKSSELIGVAEI